MRISPDRPAGRRQAFDYRAEQGRRHRLAIGVALCIVFASGCGRKGPSRYEVRGRVTWEGRPIPTGTIVMEPQDQSVAGSSGKIVDGQYRFACPAGPMHVRIFATREVGEVDPVMHQRRTEAYIPIEFNGQTKLTADITPGGKNEFDFRLP